MLTRVNLVHEDPFLDDGGRLQEGGNGGAIQQDGADTSMPCSPWEVRVKEVVRRVLKR